MNIELLVKKTSFFLIAALFTGMAFSASEGTLKEGMINPGFYEKPDWFKSSFLDLQEDVQDAKENNRRLMLYFHQDGCPYCKKLLDDNFSRPAIVNTMRRHYDLLEINMWGDKTVTLMNGEELTEKEFAQKMKVMFTPTLVVLDLQGQAEFRMNGYYAPDKFKAVLDYLLLNEENKLIGFNAYYRQQQLEQQQTGAGREKNVRGLHREKFIVQENNLQKLLTTSDKPLMLLFEQTRCSECDELHGDIFRRLPVYQKLSQFKIVQIDINSTESITAPDGQIISKKKWAKHLNIHYTPSILFYETGKNSSKQAVFRSEAYLKSFHLEALLDYINSKAYHSEPEFQRFIQRRADKMSAEGIEVDLWD